PGRPDRREGNAPGAHADQPRSPGVHPRPEGGHGPRDPRRPGPLRPERNHRRGGGTERLNTRWAVGAVPAAASACTDTRPTLTRWPPSTCRCGATGTWGGRRFSRPPFGFVPMPCSVANACALTTLVSRLPPFTGR